MPERSQDITITYYIWAVDQIRRLSGENFIMTLKLFYFETNTPCECHINQQLCFWLNLLVTAKAGSTNPTLKLRYTGFSNIHPHFSGPLKGNESTSQNFESQLPKCRNGDWNKRSTHPSATKPFQFFRAVTIVVQEPSNNASTNWISKWLQLLRLGLGQQMTSDLFFSDMKSKHY